jgi:hypothetical protein
LLSGRIDFHGDHATLQSIRELRARCAKDPSSNIVLAISRVPENALRLIFSTVHSCGLPSWRPDLIGGTPTSLYNGALEAIALWTFEQAATTFAYAHLSPNMTYLQDTSLIQKLYKNFLWSYLKRLALKEQKEPGSVARAVQENKAYKSRTEVLIFKSIISRSPTHFQSTAYQTTLRLVEEQWMERAFAALGHGLRMHI